MDREQTISHLRDSESELRALGVTSLSLFGSTARGEGGLHSDIDLAATFDSSKDVGLFKFIAIEEALRNLLNKPVDLVGEPARMNGFQAKIDRDRVRVF